MTTSIIITGHGAFSDGFKSALKLLLGEISDVYFVNFNEEFESYQTKLVKEIKALSSTSEKVIVFTDLAGGSPFNVSCLAAKDCENVEVISGSNLPMIIDTITNAMYELRDIVVEDILSTGQEAIVSFKKNNVKKEVTEEDGI